MIHRWPDNYQAAFAIRDDDTSYFTKPKMIESVFGDSIKTGHKISLSTIPNVKSVDEYFIPPDYRSTNSYHHISDNSTLVNFLKSYISSNKLDIIQHGYSHSESDLDSGPRRSSEFFNLNKQDIVSRLNKGKIELESSLDVDVSVLVTPHEYASSNLLDSISGLYSAYCGHLPLSSIKYSSLFLLNSLYAFRHGKIGLQLTGSKLNPLHLFPSCGHRWLDYSDEEKAELSYSRFKQILNYTIEHGGYFILVTHLWEFFWDWDSTITNSLQKKYFDKIINYVNQQENIWKCSVTDLSLWLKDNVRL